MCLTMLCPSGAPIPGGVFGSGDGLRTAAFGGKAAATTSCVGGDPSRHQSLSHALWCVLLARYSSCSWLPLVLHLLAVTLSIAGFLTLCDSKSRFPSPRTGRVHGSPCKAKENMLLLAVAETRADAQAGIWDVTWHMVPREGSFLSQRLCRL